MKPRLVVPSVTDEDLEIWWRVVARLGTPPGRVPTLFWSAVQGDRRDADHMLHLGSVWAFGINGRGTLFWRIGHAFLGYRLDEVPADALHW